MLKPSFFATLTLITALHSIAFSETLTERFDEAQKRGETAHGEAYKQALLVVIEKEFHKTLKNAGVDPEVTARPENYQLEVILTETMDGNVNRDLKSFMQDYFLAPNVDLSKGKEIVLNGRYVFQQPLNQTICEVQFGAVSAAFNPISGKRLTEEDFGGTKVYMDPPSCITTLE